MIEEQIKSLLAQQNKKLKDLCAYIDLTDTGLREQGQDIQDRLFSFA